MKRNKSIILTIFYQTFPVLLFTTIGEGFTGIILSNMENELKLLPGLLILVPAITDLRGNIGTAFGSRLSTMLHLGLIKPLFRTGNLVRENIYASFSLSIGMAVFLGFLAHFFSTILNIESVGPLKLSLIALMSALISSTILLPIVFFLTMGFYRKGIDPDNVIAPLLPVFGDIVTVGAIFLSSRIVLKFFTYNLSYLYPALLFFGIAGVVKEKELKYRFLSIIKESIPTLILCSILSGISGTILRTGEKLFFTFPGVISLVPQVVEKGGSIGGVIGARMSTALYLGQTKPFKIDKTVMGNFVGGMILGLLISPLVGILVYFLLWVFHMKSIGFFYMVMLSTLSISFLSITMSFLSIVIASISFFFDLNPSNIVIPTITSLGDIIGVSFLFFMLRFLPS